MGNVVVAIKPSSSGGASGVTRYIAESKRNPKKEGLQDKEPRPLLSANEDKLTYLEANELLAQTSGSLAEKEDLVHIVISLEKEDFEQLGETREEQIERRSWLMLELEQLEAPLLHFGCWPDGSRAALAISGDIDSVTIQDFFLRVFDVRQKSH